MTREDAEEAVALLEWMPILEALRTERLDRRDLQERFDMARSTAYRTTVDLENQGLIEATDAGFRLTPYGRGVAGTNERYVEALAVAKRLRPLLAFVDHPMLVDSLHLFADAEVMRPDPGEPFRLIEWLTERTAEVERYRSLAPIVGTAQQWNVPEERAQAGADMEAVFTREHLSGWADAVPERLAATLRLPNCNGFVTEDEPLPLKIFDETVVVVGVDDHDGLPRVCAVTERVAARDWAESVFRRCRRGADPIDVDELAV